MLRVVKAAQRLGFTLAEVADLTAVRDTLREAISAGCDDLITCAGNSRCPSPIRSTARLRSDA
ncbi:hypothetical protein [Micromonospora sp. CNB394]|uniref:hypothetical protein n=1 Tax=Micromonospora sp. CNB394 TaxID=1169151 RepID=UPI001E28AB0C|nr:hypothetical protein [Micromonospora sp. CNB394]